MGLALLPPEKLVGMVLAHHIDKETGSIKVRQVKIAEETGYSVRSVKRAIQGLIEVGVFESKKTRGAAILHPKHFDAGKEGGMDRPPVAPVKGHRWHIKLARRAAPWVHDTELSTQAEEEGKRIDKQLGLRER